MVEDRDFLVRLDPRDVERLLTDVVQDGEALFPLAYQVMRAIGGGDEPHDGGGRADPMETLRTRVFGGRVLLEQ